MALGQGSRLLESINEPVVRDPDHNMNQDELENLATVQRLEPGELIEETRQNLISSFNMRSSGSE